MNRKLFFTTVTAIVVGMAGQGLMAQQRSVADRRQHPGVGFWAQQSSSRRVSHALDYSRSLQDYSQRAKTVEPAVAKLHVEEIGRDLEVAKKQIAMEHKEAEKTGDKEAIADLEKIAKSLKTAEEAHADCKAHCEQGSIDTAQLATSAEAVTKALQPVSKTQKQMIKRQHPGTSSKTN